MESGAISVLVLARAGFRLLGYIINRLYIVGVNLRSVQEVDVSTFECSYESADAHHHRGRLTMRGFLGFIFTLGFRSCLDCPLSFGLRNIIFSLPLY